MAGLEAGPAAVLWDLDGTLVDTEPYWMVAEIALVEEHGGTWTVEQAKALVGHELRTSARYLQRHGGVRMEVDAIVHRLLGDVIGRMREHVPWQPGARRLLDELREAAIPCALVTMSWTSLARAFLDVAPRDTFSAVVTGDQVEQGKPHPEPYLRAAQLLGVAPSDAVAIEDSPTGVASATAAGVPVLAVPHVVPVQEGPGRVVHPTLQDVDIAFLRDVVQRARTGRPGRPVDDSVDGRDGRSGAADGSDGSDDGDQVGGQLSRC